ncbi:hypothetical protein ABT168_39010 [Streptomyces sp. NPDC001793]|uniref:hypothetical protein n=1 Tax=Streptomyces sp. NPDC001793 TaxID=3154657 RepID=UPI00331D7AAC
MNGRGGEDGGTATAGKAGTAVADAGRAGPARPEAMVVVEELHRSYDAEPAWR